MGQVLSFYLNFRKFQGSAHRWIHGYDYTRSAGVIAFLMHYYKNNDKISILVRLGVKSNKVTRHAIRKGREDNKMHLLIVRHIYNILCAIIIRIRKYA